jgi:hypothetical protein
MSSIHLKPAAGRIVRAPDGQIVPPEGLHLVRDLYIQRRIADVDLEVVTAAPEAEAEQHGQAEASPTPPQPAPPATPANRKKGTDA